MSAKTQLHGRLSYCYDWATIFDDPAAFRARLREFIDNGARRFVITIGMILGNADLKAVFSDRRAWLITFGRLIVYPAAAILVLCSCGVFRLHPQAREIITVVALSAGAHAAVMVTQFTQMYRSEEEAQFSSAVNIMSTVLCLGTMPLISWLYQTLAY